LTFSFFTKEKGRKGEGEKEGSPPFYSRISAHERRRKRAHRLSAPLLGCGKRACRKKKGGKEMAFLSAAPSRRE